MKRAFDVVSRLKFPRLQKMLIKSHIMPVEARLQSIY